MRSVTNTSPTVAVSTTGGRRRGVDTNKLLTIAVFLLLPGIVYTIFVLLPVLQAIYYSIYRWNGLGPPSDMVGLGNFTRALGDGMFRGAIGHNFIIVVLSIALQLPLALALALLVNRGLRGRTIFRMIFFLPYVLSEVITGVVWNFVYKPDNGLLNTFLNAVVPGFEPVGWLGNTQTVLGALFVVMTWKYFGLHLLLFLAALQNVPVELEEAAAIDGATRWQTIRRIVIPLLGSTARLSVYLSALGSLQIFDLVWVMTTGGPVGASETMATSMYKFGFQRFAIGYGSAVAVVIFVLCLLFSVIYQRASGQSELA